MTRKYYILELLHYICLFGQSISIVSQGPMSNHYERLIFLWSLMSLLHHYVHSNVLFILTVADLERNYYCQTFEDEAFLNGKGWPWTPKLKIPFILSVATWNKGFFLYLRLQTFVSSYSVRKIVGPYSKGNCAKSQNGLLEYGN